jgi:type III secretion protein HrpB1
MENNPTRDTQSLVRALEAREDLLNAMKVKRAGGQFVTPKSCEALAEFDAETAEGAQSAEPATAAAPAPAAAAPVDYAHQSFLRA